VPPFVVVVLRRADRAPLEALDSDAAEEEERSATAA
jgi:hypothetical protein